MNFGYLLNTLLISSVKNINIFDDNNIFVKRNFGFLEKKIYEILVVLERVIKKR